MGSVSDSVVWHAHCPTMGIRWKLSSSQPRFY
jgi:hypothetical protein